MTDQALLSAYLDGELSPNQVGEVEKRLSADPQFRREHLRLQQVSAILEVRCEPDPGFLIRHRQRREDLSPVLQWTWRQLGYRLAAVAAAMLVAAGLSVWQAEWQEVDTLANTTAAAGELDLLDFEGEILGGQIPAASDFASLTAADPTEEPVLLIALGAGFAPSGER